MPSEEEMYLCQNFTKVCCFWNEPYISWVSCFIGCVRKKWNIAQKNNLGM